MSEKFDPYHAWLGIPPEEQPPNHYRLLGIEAFESDLDAIESAADQRTGNLHAYQKGEHAGLSMRLLNEVSVAKVCLMNPNRKAAYDKGLQERLAIEAQQSEAVERARCQRFLAILQEKDLLSSDLIEAIRRQLAGSAKGVSVASLAGRLIDEGHLTPAIAERLLAAATKATKPPTSRRMQSQPKAKPRDVGSPRPAESEDHDLGLAPLDEQPATQRPVQKKKPQTTPQPKASAGKAKSQRTAPRPPESPPVQPHVAAPAAASSLLDEELQPVEPGPAAGLGPLDGLMAGASVDAAAGGSALKSAPRKKGLRGLFGRPKQVGRKANVWDSPLLLVGGGTLLAMVILGAVLIWALRGQTADQALGQAHEDYRAGKYAQAIHKYGLYLEKFPEHEGVSLARVNSGLCKLRQKAGRGTRDWPTALQTANEVLKEIRPEKKFSEAQGDLSGLLLGIAEGLSAMARQNPNRELVARTNEALDLLELNVPKSLRRGDKIADVEAELALTVRDIDRGEELKRAIDAIGRAVDGGDTQQAYSIRTTLLKQYPVLADDPQLRQAVMQVSGAQQKAVRWVEKQQPGEKSEPTPTVLSAVGLAQSTKTNDVPDVEGQVVFASAAGAAYGLDATTGKVLWRRFLGFAVNGQGIGFPPTPIFQQEDPGSDALLVDPIRHEVLRVEAATGKLGSRGWRHAIGEPFDAHPVIAGNRILLATRSGRLEMIDTRTGGSSGHVQLPQPLHVAPAVDLRRELIFQIADHSNLFVLGLADGECKAVVYLEHEPGSITAPPVVVSRFLILAVNDRSKDSLLRILIIEKGDEGLVVKPVQAIRLQGHVDTAPLVAGRRVLVATDRGMVSVFEISTTDDEKPLGKIADSSAPGEENVIRFPLMEAGQFWIGDVQLTRYEIHTSRSQLEPTWVMDDDSVFQQPLVAVGPAIFHVRRKLGMPGVVVSAVGKHQRKRFWETHLAVPLADEPTVDTAGNKITAVTSIGGVFQISATGLKQQTGVVDQPEAALATDRLKRPLTTVIRLAGGLMALTGGEDSREIVVYDPRRQPPFRTLELPDALACPPLAFGGGLLAPSKVGPVLLLDPRTGAAVAEPFQPRLQPGVKLAWRSPGVHAEHGLVLADGHTKVYRLGVVDQPPADLVALDRAEVSEPIVSPVAVAGELAYAVDLAGVLTALKLPKLTRVEAAEQLLGGRCVWGPQSVGNYVMLSTDDELLCVDGSGQLRWRVKLPYGPLAGAPLEVDDHYLLASASGVVWRMDAATGKELARDETGRPLATGPVLLENTGPLGNQLLLGGHDGTLYRIEQPTPQR